MTHAFVFFLLMLIGTGDIVKAALATLLAMLCA
jgi:hypothetical protein